MKFLLVYTTLFVFAKAATPKNTVTKLFPVDYKTPEGIKIRKMTLSLDKNKIEEKDNEMMEQMNEEINQLYQDYMTGYYPKEKCWTIKKFEVKSGLGFEHWIIIDRKCYNAARIIRVFAAYIGFTVLFVVTAMIVDRKERNKLNVQIYKFVFFYVFKRFFENCHA